MTKRKLKYLIMTVVMAVFLFPSKILAYPDRVAPSFYIPTCVPSIKRYFI